MSCKYVVGHGLDLERAMAAWAALAPGTALHPVPLAPDADHVAMERALGSLDPEGATAFVAIGPHFLNFHRVEAMSLVRGRGLAMPPLVERGAIVADGVKLVDNTWIGAGAVVQPGCRIGFNVTIGAGTIVGAGVEIGQSAYLDAGVVVGHGARIGGKATIGMGVVIGHGVAIGKLCVIDRPGRIDANVADKTFIQTSHAQPMVIVGA